ncbi:MAG: hypothetical protein QMB51_02020 [Patescibacteria group bacterium]
MNEFSQKILILYNSIPYFVSYFSSRNISISYVNKELSLFKRIIRKFSKILNINQNIWYNTWKKEVNLYDCVIIFAPIDNYSIIDFILSNNPAARIIIWHWNPIYRIGYIQSDVIKKVELWSFDPNDCIKYKMKYNSTFYFNDIKIKSITSYKYDIVFLGNDKGRKDTILKFQKELEKTKLSYYFHIVSENKGRNSQKKITYAQYLDLIANSKAILDLTPFGQSGLTLRPMESIFLKKKLITFDKNIIKQDFYRSENIFIIGIDDLLHLNSFVNSPYFNIDDKIINNYDFNSWLCRFSLK